LSIAIAIDHRCLQGQPHGAHLHLDLAGAGLGAHQVNDRAIHIHVTAKKVHRFCALVHHAIALGVALIDSAKANRWQLLFSGIKQAAAGNIHERQLGEQFAL
jgi:hypothetical protein